VAPQVGGADSAPTRLASLRAAEAAAPGRAVVVDANPALPRPAARSSNPDVVAPTALKPPSVTPESTNVVGFKIPLVVKAFERPDTLLLLRKAPIRFGLELLNVFKIPASPVVEEPEPGVK